MICCQSGVILPGTFLVVTGGDLSGSKLFLEHLAGRCQPGQEDKGIIQYLCGDEIVNDDIERHVAYVSGDDILPANLTGKTLLCVCMSVCTSARVCVCESY